MRTRSGASFGNGSNLPNERAGELLANSVVAAVLDALERLRIPHMLVGSFASNLHGIPRSTKDVDFVLELGEHTPSEIARQLGAGFVLDPQVSFESHGDDPHDQAHFRRREQQSLVGRNAFVATAEDTVI